MERWITYEHADRLTCPCCGDEIKVLTSLSQQEIADGWYKDSDSVECVDKNCDLENGQISADGDDCWVNGDW